ncbi:MAG TPA: DNA mismatch repair endonuclease MutL [Syntrophus sp. (in: bacteria)]|nr:DNA mismatch repair endonuclease MutL [Syntrophus sp. (in: bacteria)]
MGKIAVLPEVLTNRIAAGEVVERPASIVKELLENALDAGAGAVGIELRQGGCGAIRVTDDGEGMEAADVPLAFSRFATSKIASFEDIYRIRSFGFRGEALPSIAAVSRVTLITRRRDRPTGTRLIVEAGQILEVTDCGCPAGTSILVENIFDPVPVRKKFLKRESTELAACLETITRVALPHRHVRVGVQANGRSVMSLPATEGDRERLGLLLGEEAAGHLLPFSGFRETAALSGFCSRPAWTRSDGKQIFCYVNGRFVRDPLLQHAVMTAYRRLIEARRYPACILYLDVPPEEVDVNVHPAKAEVRFRQPREIYALIVEGLVAALSGSPAVPSAPPADLAREPLYQARIEEAMKRYTVSSGRSKRLFAGLPAVPAVRPGRDAGPPAPPATAGPSPEAAIRFTEGTYLGQVLSTYLVFAHPAGILLMDQHAAHERVLFERLRTSGAAGKVVTQQLLLPEVISLRAGEFQLALSLQTLWDELGFTIEPFGDTSIAVKAVPALVPNLDPRQTVRDLLSELSELPATAGLQEQRDGFHAVLACQGAVKAHQELTEAEVGALCRELDAISFPSTCPHGRPTYVLIDERDLKRMFRRT